MWLLTPTKAADDDGQPGSCSEYEVSLRQLGVTDSDLAATKHRAEAGDSDESAPFRAWPWHLPAMRAFGAMRTQWHTVAAMTGLIYLGLNYSSWPVVKSELGLEGEGAGLFEQLQAMERGALPYRNRSLNA